MCPDEMWLFGLNLTLTPSGEKKLAFNQEVLVLNNFLILVELREISSSIPLLDLKSLLSILIDVNITPETLTAIKNHLNIVYSEICTYLKGV